MGRRTLLLIAALVVAVLGTVLVFLYAQNADKRATADQQQVQVLVAKTAIGVGTAGAAASSAGAFDLQNVPVSNVAPGALSDATPIADQVALQAIFPGQQILAAMWGAAGQSAGLAIPPGKIAISVSVADPARVAGFVKPGSEVALFTYGLPKTGGATVQQPTVKTLLAKVPILAVGATTAGSAATGTSSGNTEAVPTTLFTVAVTQREAEQILYVTTLPGGSFNGITFALLGKDSKIDLGTSVNGDNLFVG